MMKAIVFILALFVIFSGKVSANRAFLKSPTSRQASWKYFLTSWKNVVDLKINTDFDQLNCGKQKISKGQIGGKCGVCGDPYNGPRNNELPNGIYAYKRPTFVYKEGTAINVTVEITERTSSNAGHGGHFIFKLCDQGVFQTQACFDKHVLTLHQSTKTYIPVPYVSGDVILPLQLPSGVTCKFCTMQFIFVTGEGETETIVNCADIMIIGTNDVIPSDFLKPDYTSQYSSLHDEHHEKTTKLNPTVPETDKIIDIITFPNPTTTPVTSKTSTTPSTNTVSTSVVLTTTTDVIPKTAERLVLPPVVIAPAIGGAAAGSSAAGAAGAGAVAGGEAALSAGIGGIPLAPLGLLFGLGLLGGMGNSRRIPLAHSPFHVPPPYYYRMIDPYSYVGFEGPGIRSPPFTPTSTGPQTPEFSSNQYWRSGGYDMNADPNVNQGGLEYVGEGWGLMETVQPEWVYVDKRRGNNQLGAAFSSQSHSVEEEYWLPNANRGVELRNANPQSNILYNPNDPFFSGSRFQRGSSDLNGQHAPLQSSLYQEMGRPNFPLRGDMSPRSRAQHSPMPRGPSSNMIGQYPTVETGPFPGKYPIQTQGNFRNNPGPQFRGTDRSRHVAFNDLPRMMSNADNSRTFIRSQNGNEGFFELPDNYQTAPMPIRGQDLFREVGNPRNIAKEFGMEDTHSNGNPEFGPFETLNDERPRSSFMEFDKEPGVIAQRKSPFSKGCKRRNQVCRPTYGNTDTLYGEVSIFGMICEIECENGNLKCPVDICTCECPRIDIESMLKEMQAILKHKHHIKNLKREKAAAAKFKSAINGNRNTFRGKFSSNRASNKNKATRNRFNSRQGSSRG